jgi:hypothetical protein
MAVTKRREGLANEKGGSRRYYPQETTRDEDAAA